MPGLDTVLFLPFQSVCLFFFLPYIVLDESGDITHPCHTNFGKTYSVLFKYNTICRFFIEVLFDCGSMYFMFTEK
jgi:hypothetical protein